MIEETAQLNDKMLKCRAQVRPDPHCRAVAIDVFDARQTRIASLLARCSPRCPDFATIAAMSEQDLERYVLSQFLSGSLSLDLGRVIDLSEQLRSAGRVDYPGQVIIELHRR